MSRNPADKWLEAIKFELFRLSPEHNKFSTGYLEWRIKQLESMPVTEGARIDLQDKIHQLECLKQDLGVFRAEMAWTRKMCRVSEKARDKGRPARGYEIFESFNELDTSFEKVKMEQRERQRQHLASFRQIWPNADAANKAQMVKWLAIYSRRRLRIGTGNSLWIVPNTIFRWWTRGAKGLPRR